MDKGIAADMSPLELLEHIEQAFCSYVNATLADNDPRGASDAALEAGLYCGHLKSRLERRGVPLEAP